jgi:glycine cleavage system H lipoate-binding protein
MVAGSEEHIKFFNSDVLCYLSGININGQQKWVERYGGGNPDRANSIIKVDGGFVFAGVTETWGADGTNMYVVKIDAGGKRLWHNAFGYDYDEDVQQVIATRDGGYILVGSTNSDHRKLSDVYVVKIDANGNKQWQHRYGGRADEEGFGIVEDDDGYVIVGSTESTKDRTRDLYLLKIDRNGAVFWVKTYGGLGDDAGHAIVKADDGFVITGYSQGPISRGKDLYLLKVDKNGNLN